MTTHTCKLTQHFLDVCRFAYTQGASDIHFEPTATHLQIRMRQNGILVPVQAMEELPSRMYLDAAKGACSMTQSLRGIPQDTSFGHPSEPVDFRASLIPVRDGEKLVLRILERHKDFSLDTCGLPPDALSDLQSALKTTSGLIVVSGPTGSGKSTLLYSALAALNRQRQNIATIEDPLEYRLEGINQSQVDPTKNVGFSELLRALMRQDPDVIMIGEIRDAQTASIATHAAQTGHLVLSTIHANTVTQIPARLQGLGIPPSTIQDTLRFASSQRLARLLCPHCLCDDQAPDQGDLSLLDLPEGFHPKSSPGCDQCQDTGISGRTLLLEWQTDSTTPPHVTLTDLAIRLLRQGRISLREARAHVV